MLLNCRSLSSRVRRLVACMGQIHVLEPNQQVPLAAAPSSRRFDSRRLPPPPGGSLLRPPNPMEDGRRAQPSPADDPPPPDPPPPLPDVAPPPLDAPAPMKDGRQAQPRPADAPQRPESMHSRGCLGCCTKPTPITAVDEPSKGLRIQGLSIRKASLPEDFWSTSAHEIENSAIQSQRSMSSISMAAQSSDQHGAGSSNNPSKFVNQGLVLWNQTRQQWVGSKNPNSRPQQPREPKISWNATYESLLGSNKPFSQPIPLAEMVELLVDAWEQEGLYG